MDLEILLILQQLREALGPNVEALMNVITALPSNPLMLLIPCILYWCVDKDRGIFVLFNVGIASVVNQLIKISLCVYRPWIRDARIHPSLAALPKATGYSFPSGHTQIMASTFGSMAWTYRKKSRLLVGGALALILLVAFSRCYLGVHTPQDVLVSLLECALVMRLTVTLFRWMAKNPEKDIPVLVGGLLLVVLPLAFAALKKYPVEFTPAGNLLVNPKEMVLDSYEAAGALSGIILGWFAEKRLVGFSTDCPLLRKVIRFLCGVATVAVAALVIHPLFEVFGPLELAEFMHGFLPILAGVFVGPALGERIAGIGQPYMDEGAQHYQK